MPAHDFEVEEALEEGVLVKWLSTIRKAEEGRLVLERMALDEAGFPQPTGELEELEADSLVLALGQEADLGLLERLPGVAVEDGVVKVGPDLMTGHAGVFAGGDIVPAERTVTVGVGHGQTAARNIDPYLRGTAPAPAPDREPAPFEGLNTWYYADAPKTVRPQLELARRASTFDEVVGGLDPRPRSSRRGAACRAATASRATTATASVRTPPSSSSTGAGRTPTRSTSTTARVAGLCAAECPAGAIAMEPEEI